MSAPSPSEFLTFYRGIRTSPTLRRSSLLLRPTGLAQRRAFTISPLRQGTGNPSTNASTTTSEYPDDKHTTNKKDDLDVQSENSTKGRGAHATGQGGTATERTDDGSTARAKKEHPEAPDVVIGMQDERGGKGNKGNTNA